MMKLTRKRKLRLTAVSIAGVALIALIIACIVYGPALVMGTLTAVIGMIVIFGITVGLLVITWMPDADPPQN